MVTKRHDTLLLTRHALFTPTDKETRHIVSVWSLLTMVININKGPKSRRTEEKLHTMSKLLIY